MKVPGLDPLDKEELQLYGAIQIPGLFLPDHCPDNGSLCIVEDLSKELIGSVAVVHGHERDKITTGPARLQDSEFHLDDNNSIEDDIEDRNEGGLGAIFSVLSSTSPGAQFLITAGRGPKIDNSAIRIFDYSIGAIVIAQYRFDRYVSTRGRTPLGPTWHMAVVQPGERDRTIVDVYPAVD